MLFNFLVMLLIFRSVTIVCYSEQNLLSFLHFVQYIFTFIFLFWFHAYYFLFIRDRNTFDGKMIPYVSDQKRFLSKVLLLLSLNRVQEARSSVMPSYIHVSSVTLL